MYNSTNWWLPVGPRDSLVSRYPVLGSTVYTNPPPNCIPLKLDKWMHVEVKLRASISTYLTCSIILDNEDQPIYALPLLQLRMHAI